MYTALFHPVSDYNVLLYVTGRKIDTPLVHEQCRKDRPEKDGQLTNYTLPKKNVIVLLM